MPSIVRKRCRSMNDDLEGHGHGGRDKSSTLVQGIENPRYYTFLRQDPITEPHVITRVKGIVDSLDSVESGEALMKAGIDSLIEDYRTNRTIGHSVSSNTGLREFVDFYCDKMVITVSTPPSTPGGAGDRTTGSIVQVDSFSCPVCYGVFIDPVTILCGHSLCRKCLHKFTPGKKCRRCNHILGIKDIARDRVNVMVKVLVEKWWPNYVAANNLRNAGNQLFDGSEGDVALSKYTEAIDLCQDDHLSLGNRALTLLTLGRSEEALVDAEAAIKSCSVWAKGYFRKAVTLSSLGRFEEAFVTLTVCLYLVNATKTNDEAAVIPLKCELMKVLHKIFLQSVGSSGIGNVTVRRGSVSIPALRRGRDFQRVRFQPCVESLRQKTPVSRIQKRNFRLMNLPEPNVKKIHRVFTRAMKETKRIQREVVERTKTVADQPPPRRSSVLRLVDRALVNVSDFECTLCYRLLYQPISSACGHTFCKPCLERSLDHSSSCPLCKSVLHHSSVQQKSCTTYFLQIAIEEFLSAELSERIKQHEAELLEMYQGSSEGLEIPIFVCTVAFPTVPCPLHVFEPRYRLMIRRSMESGSRKFGMCCYSQGGENNYADFGTLLEIQNVQYFADGRSVIETVGMKRFKILKRSQKDGYHTANVDIIHDSPIAPEDFPRIQQGHDKVYNEAADWLSSISQILRQRINTHFGVMPTPEENWLDLPDGPAWAWWLLAILPLDTKAQLAILSMKKLEVRLQSIFKVLAYVKSNNM